MSEPIEVRLSLDELRYVISCGSALLYVLRSPAEIATQSGHHDDRMS